MTSRIGITVSGGKLRVDIDGTQADADDGLRQLGKLLVDTSATAHKLEAELPMALAARDAAALRHSRASQFPLSAVLPGRASRLRPGLDVAAATLQELAGRRNACAVILRFEIGEAALDAFARLAAAHAGLARSARIWEVPHGEVADTMSAAPPRVAVTAKPFLPQFMVSRWPGLAIQEREGAGIALFPGFIMAQRPGGFGGAALTDLLTVTLDAGEVRLPERETLPPDATVVDQAWERVNLDGNPDRRYANNTRIPFVAYGCLRLAIGANHQRAFLVSNRMAAAGLAEAFNSFQATLRAASPGTVADGCGRDAWPTAGPEPVVRVPPPPRASAAHEVTAAAVVAIGLTGWSLPSLPTSRPQATALAPLASMAPEPSPTAVPRPDPSRAEPAREPIQPTSLHALAPAASEPPAAVQAEAARPTAAAAAVRREQVVTRTGANVRAGPNGSAEVIRTVPASVRMSVFSRAPGGWVQVGDTGPWGWIHSSLLDAAE